MFGAMGSEFGAEEGNLTFDENTTALGGGKAWYLSIVCAL